MPPHGSTTEQRTTNYRSAAAPIFTSSQARAASQWRATVRPETSSAEAVSATVIDGAKFPYPLEASRGTQVMLDTIFERLGQAE